MKVIMYYTPKFNKITHTEIVYDITDTQIVSSKSSAPTFN